MSKKQLNLTCALRDGKPVDIEDVESGLKCGCVCPVCGETLVAKKGMKLIHHFAHYSGNTCEYGYETSLHMLAKEILSETKEITIPPVYISFPSSSKEKQLYSPAKTISVDRVELETHFGNVVPDVVIYTGGKKLFLKIYVAHPISKATLFKLKKENISSIRINLSKIEHTITRQELHNILLQDYPEKKWNYNSKANEILNEFYAVSDKKPLVHRAKRIYCPFCSHIWPQKVYPDFMADCSRCPYCMKYFSYEGEYTAILCSERNRISTLEDLKKWKKRHNIVTQL